MSAMVYRNGQAFNHDTVIVGTGSLIFRVMLFLRLNAAPLRTPVGGSPAVTLILYMLWDFYEMAIMSTIVGRKSLN